VSDYSRSLIRLTEPPLSERLIGSASTRPDKEKREAEVLAAWKEELTGRDWSRLNAKHLDHHLKQFGV